MHSCRCCFTLRAVVLALYFSIFGSIGASAISCPIAKPHTASPAELAFQAHDYDKAAKLYQDDLAQKPNDPELTASLVRVFIRQQKLNEADALVQKAIAQQPDSSALLTAQGEMQFRAGTPWLAAETMRKALAKDPCYARLYLLEAKVLSISSLYASAAHAANAAHTLDPYDPEIRMLWLSRQPLQKRIADLETYLSKNTGGDAAEMKSQQQYLDNLKKQSSESYKPCRLVSDTQSTEIPFVQVMQDINHMTGFGLDVKLNDHPVRLQIDTGAGGLFISRAVADRAGLKVVAQNHASGIGGRVRSAYSAYADDIRIGGLEFKDCEVEVLDARSVIENDGLIGMDEFSHFLVTLDYPVRKLKLDPLPPYPGDAAPAKPTLDADNAPEGTDSGPATDKAAAPTADAAKTPAAPPSGPRDRYIAPEMQDWERVYRVGHDLLTPSILNDKLTKLFILDTGAFQTVVSPDVARQVTKVSSDNYMHVRGVGGEVEHVFTADEITFKFGGHIVQTNRSIVSFDTSNISRDVGMETAGLLGINTLGQMTMRIDYRDGLVKFVYDPKRGAKYPGMQ